MGVWQQGNGWSFLNLCVVTQWFRTIRVFTVLFRSQLLCPNAAGVCLSIGSIYVYTHKVSVFHILRSCGLRYRFWSYESTQMFVVWRTKPPCHPDVQWLSLAWHRPNGASFQVGCTLHFHTSCSQQWRIDSELALYEDAHICVLHFQSLKFCSYFIACLAGLDDSPVTSDILCRMNSSPSPIMCVCVDICNGFTVNLQRCMMISVS